MDPFLLLDNFEGDDGGFPDHPHRGFETVTYLITGNVSHEDFCGHKGVIGPGDLQWMTAGKGIVHSEILHGTEHVHGLQLWVNLARKYKMIEPAYQELKSKEIPEKNQNGVNVRVIAGESMGIKSPVYTRTPTMYLDFRLDKGASFRQPVPTGWNGFIYILNGSGLFGPNLNEIESSAFYLLVLGDGDSVSFRNVNSEQLHFILVAGEPLNEPIVQYGPFVMNSQKEIEEAFFDYQFGKNGFENAKIWRSENGNK